MDSICLNISQAAEVLGVSRNFLYDHLLESPDFPKVRIGNRTLIPRDSLKEWIEKKAKTSQNA